MGWKNVNGKRYFYEKDDETEEWVSRGSGPEAETLAQKHATKKQFLQWWQGHVAAADDLTHVTTAVVQHQVLRMYAGAGFRRVNGTWRKKRGEQIDLEPLFDLQYQVTMGKEAMNVTVDRLPDMEDEVRRLSMEPLRMVTTQADEMMADLEVKLEEMRTEMKIDQATQLEQLLINQVLTAWVQWYVASILSESKLGEIQDWRHNDYMEKRYRRSQARLSKAIDQLARIRCLPRKYLEMGRG